MSYRITSEYGAFDGLRDPQESFERLAAALDGLIAQNMIHLRWHPTAPLLYQSGVRYEEEPLGAEFWRDIPMVLKYGTGDCLPLSTLVLRDDYSFCPIADLRPGDRIMEDGQLTTVQEVMITGKKPVLALGLDNGCALRTSPDHRLFTVDDQEVRAEAVRIGDRLRAPTRPFPATEPFRPDERLSDTDLAWLLGVYIGDGWHQANRFCISGFDERPKRGKLEQKKRVVDICDRAGIATRWAKKYVAVSDTALAEIMHTAGTHAPVKRVPTMRWSRDQAESLLEGLQTDCSTANSGTLTYGTTSPTLALQLRILHRMMDQSVHIREWSAAEHKGLGQNPMIRIGIRSHADEDTNAIWKTRAEQYRTSVRVRSIVEQDEEICADITTDSGRFYLPESDTIVHNCEDLASWLIAEKRVRFNVPARPLIIPQFQAPTPAQPNGSFLYHVAVATPDAPGGVDDPSRRLGMR